MIFLFFYLFYLFRFVYIIIFIFLICRLFIKYDFTTVKTSQVEVELSFKDLWKTCVYGAHPQTLLVASRSSIDLFDFRVFFLYSIIYNCLLVLYIN
jgi:hypothetical protein